jgi:L-threonate 2-dehydrogenase
MALGLREGVDPDALYEVITNSAGNSWMFENRVPHILVS